jgi:hypothetical protein
MHLPSRASTPGLAPRKATTARRAGPIAIPDGPLTILAPAPDRRTQEIARRADRDLTVHPDRPMRLSLAPNHRMPLLLNRRRALGPRVVNAGAVTPIATHRPLLPPMVSVMEFPTRRPETGTFEPVCVPLILFVPRC